MQFFGIHDEEVHSCEIMGPTGFLVQLSMGVIAFLVLIYKRLIEDPRRDWTVWALDTSKQLISMGMAHILNVTLALLMTTIGAEDSCSWYFVTFLLDTSFGTCLNLLQLYGVEKLIAKGNREHLKSGNYFKETKIIREPEKTGEFVQIEDVYIDISYVAWTLQLLIWCGIVIMVLI